MKGTKRRREEEEDETGPPKCQDLWFKERLEFYAATTEAKRRKAIAHLKDTLFAGIPPPILNLVPFVDNLTAHDHEPDFAFSLAVLRLHMKTKKNFDMRYIATTAANHYDAEDPRLAMILKALPLDLCEKHLDVREPSDTLHLGRSFKIFFTKLIPAGLVLSAKYWSPSHVLEQINRYVAFDELCAHLLHYVASRLNEDKGVSKAEEKRVNAVGRLMLWNESVRVAFSDQNSRLISDLKTIWSYFPTLIIDPALIRQVGSEKIDFLVSVFGHNPKAYHIQWTQYLEDPNIQVRDKITVIHNRKRRIALFQFLVYVKTKPLVLRRHPLLDPQVLRIPLKIGGLAPPKPPRARDLLDFEF